MAKRILGVLAISSMVIVACESNTNNGPSGLPGSSGTSGVPGSSGNPGNPTTSGGPADGGGMTADAGEGGSPVSDGASDAPVGPTQCTWTATGAMAANGTCTFTVAYGASKNELGFSMTGMPDQVNFGGAVAGKTTLTAGTYTLADMPQAGGTFIPAPTTPWAMCNNDNCSDGMGNPTPNQGTFTLSISDPGPVTAGVLWQKAHGTLTMTLPADPNTSASGTVTLTAVF